MSNPESPYDFIRFDFFNDAEKLDFLTDQLALTCRLILPNTHYYAQITKPIFILEFKEMNEAVEKLILQFHRFDKDWIEDPNNREFIQNTISSTIFLLKNENNRHYPRQKRPNNKSKKKEKPVHHPPTLDLKWMQEKRHSLQKRKKWLKRGRANLKKWIFEHNNNNLKAQTYFASIVSSTYLSSLKTILETKRNYLMQLANIEEKVALMRIFQNINISQSSININDEIILRQLLFKSRHP